MSSNSNDPDPVIADKHNERLLRPEAATRFHSRQRHAASYVGVEATDRLILFDDTHVARLRDGRIIVNIRPGPLAAGKHPVADIQRPS